MENKEENKTVDLAKAMNIPEYDEVKYPRLNDAQMQDAALFMYQLSLIGSCADGNLQNLLWHVYLHMSNVIKETGLSDEKLRKEKLLKSLDNLKDYVKTSGNPVFKRFADYQKDL